MLAIGKTWMAKKEIVDGAISLFSGRRAAGQHVVLCRNPAQHWCSFDARFAPRGNRFFQARCTQNHSGSGLKQHTGD